MTPRRNRIPRERVELTRAMESHLYFLWEARQRYPQQPDRYKQIAAELRVLVCKTRQNQPLLLNLMDDYGFSYEVQPPGPPFDMRPIPLVDDLAQSNFARRLESANLGNGGTQEELLHEQASLRRPISFREYVDRGLAVFILGRSYSYCELALAIAQQLGSGHEDNDVDQSIVQLASFSIAGHPGHLVPLIDFADRVIVVGSTFLGFLNLHHEYVPQYFRLPDQAPGQS